MAIVFLVDHKKKKLKNSFRLCRKIIWYKIILDTKQSKKCIAFNILSWFMCICCILVTKIQHPVNAYTHDIQSDKWYRINIYFRSITK